MAFDKNNFCWISYPNGIQRFDGKNFIPVLIQPGLPDNKLTTLFQCKNGDVLISHTHGISRYDAERNKFEQVFKNAQGDRNLPTMIGEQNGVMYIFTDAGLIISFDCKSFKQIAVRQTSLKRSIDLPLHFGDNILNNKVAVLFNFKVHLLDIVEGKVLHSSPSNVNLSPYLLWLKKDAEVLYCNYGSTNHIQSHNFITGITRPFLIKGIEPFSLNRCSILMRKKSALVSINNKLYETDTELTSVKSELVNFQNLPVADKSVIVHAREDHFGNVFLQTVTSGIKKIIGHNFPIKYYGTVKKENNNIISLLPVKKENRILAGTVGNGLMVFDTTQQLVKNIPAFAEEEDPFSTNTIIQSPAGDFLLFNLGEHKIWRLNNNLSRFTPTAIESKLPQNKQGIPYFGNKLFCDKKISFVQSQHKIYKVNFTNNKTTEHEISNSYIMGGMMHGNMIITHGGDELLFVDTASVTVIKKIPFKNTAYVRCITQDAAKNIFIGSNNGIYKIDENGKILEHFTRQSGLPDDCIYAMLFDEDGALWCSSNKGIFRLGKDKSVFVLTKEDGLQENEFNTNVAAKAEDGEMFFGGVNGISSFYPSSIGNTRDSLQLLCTQIKINNRAYFQDTSVWNINELDLPHNQNLLSFDFVAMGNSNPDQYVYQYKMEGIDEQWLQNEDMQTVRYFLPPGKYIFKMYASRFFDKEAKALKEISITIHGPFYKTWWFFGLITFLVAGIMLYAINWLNRNKYQDKLAELENEHKIQLERERISRDLHDSLGAYANAVLYNTELLQNETGIAERNELMKDLKFASKDIITSLRETVWALKKDNYSAEECMLRIRNFIQPLAKYYTAIQFNVDVEYKIEKELIHSKALNIVRIVQEAVTNSIKHANPKNIIVSSTEENGQWIIEITDDGKGFDYEKIKRDGEGNGLDNLQQRATDSGIRLKIKSSLHNGTIIKLIV